MTLTLSRNLRRALALSILAAGIFGAYALVLRPIEEGYGRDLAAAGQLRVALARYRAVGQALPELERRLAALKGSAAQRTGYLEGQSEALGAAALQERLKSLVLRAGGSLKSIQVVPGKVEGGAKRIGVRGQMVAELGALQRVIYALEAGQPYLFIDKLDIRAPSGPRQAPDAEPRLDIGFEVYGYMRGEV